jgi:hypothetical protein
MSCGDLEESAPAGWETCHYPATCQGVAYLVSDCEHEADPEEVLADCFVAVSCGPDYKTDANACAAKAPGCPIK